jgi:hypothetical protein
MPGCDNLMSKRKSRHRSFKFVEVSSHLFFFGTWGTGEDPLLEGKSDLLLIWK